MDAKKLSEASDRVYADAYGAIFRKLTAAPLSDKDQQVLKQVLIFLAGLLAVPSVFRASIDFLSEASQAAQSHMDIAECDAIVEVLRAATDAGFDAYKQGYTSAEDQGVNNEAAN